MKTNILYGKSEIELDLPEHSILIEPQNIAALNDDIGAIKSSLQHPIGTKPLQEMVQSNQTVSIVISDITRPTPNHILVPLLIETLSHVPIENFVIINGTGTHRDQTRDELIQMLGEDIVNKVKIVHNHCNDKAALKKVGHSRYGCDVYLNKEYVESDFKIVTGFIEPHFFAGFSGGPKGIMPGIAGIETIMTFHNAKMIGDIRSTWGNMYDNPVQNMTREINAMCKPDFMLNVTLNKEKDITAVFSGELYQAHDRGCEYAKAHAMFKCEKRFDVVIASNSGYPLDQNLYQTVKGMSAAHKVVKKGGSIIMFSECIDGYPDHGNFAEILKMADSPQKLLDIINDPKFGMLDQWQVQKQASIQNFADVYLYSTLNDQQTRDAMIHPIHNIADTLKDLEHKYGQDMSIGVMPLGPLTIPYVES
ncbi:nickel-dependent lactate racemase [Staphylococcus succinus]|uniref:nickel-dependent lactate racemase n=1 Tax=Staphylococcus succinus TaxID=61015 RepID=UPI000E6A7679|nr:nickel-dependent lactate racemase [Staphylococcus succinus]MEB8210290.1 nickel-dependent lactate racemase [Staphylococcus succinus]RIN37235.1 nickel-dependent lactate racemase [Staphylococcus succinus]